MDNTRYSRRDAVMSSLWLGAALVWLYVWLVLVSVVGTLAVKTWPHYTKAPLAAWVVWILQGLSFAAPILLVRRAPLKWAVAVSAGVVASLFAVLGLIAAVGQSTGLFGLSIPGVGIENALRGLGACVALAAWYSWQHGRTPDSGETSA